jgi:hypothetical protein
MARAARIRPNGTLAGQFGFSRYQLPVKRLRQYRLRDLFHPGRPGQNESQVPVHTTAILPPAQRSDNHKEALVGFRSVRGGFLRAGARRRASMTLAPSFPPRRPPFQNLGTLAATAAYKETRSGRLNGTGLNGTSPGRARKWSTSLPWTRAAGSFNGPHPGGRGNGG